MKTLLCPGTYDPVTLGHMDVFERASALCGRLIIAVAESPGKKPFFTLEARMAQVSAAVTGIANAEVVSFNCLVTELAGRLGAQAIIKGVRSAGDFEFEQTMSVYNRRLSGGRVETLLIPAREDMLFLSSSAVKQLAAYHADLSGYLPSGARGLIEAGFREYYG